MAKKSCCIVGCKNLNVGADSGVIFYKFPEEKGLRKKWIEACKKNEAITNKNWEPEATSVICNVHFVSGQKSPHDWHPDYVPSVFRSLRRNVNKKRKRYDDSDDEGSTKKNRGKRLSLSTPTRNTPKVKLAVPSTTGGLKKPLRLSKMDKPKYLNAEEVEDSNLKSPRRVGFLDEDADDPTNLSDGNKSLQKRKALIDDEDPSTPLKGLSVVLERTSDKRIKLTTGDITIKEEPVGDLDYISPAKMYRKETKPKSVTGKSPARGPQKQQSSKAQCKKCSSLEQKLLRVERSLISSSKSGKCKRCPVIEHELKKVEEELEDIIESKLTKCQRCSLVEQKCKRIESNLRKAQTELNSAQNRLTIIELNEEAFMKYKSKVKLYTGFPNFESLTLVFEHVKTSLPTELSKGLTHFQMFVLVLMRLKLNLPFWDLTYRFGTSLVSIQALYPQYISVLDSTLSHVVLWPKANMKFRLEVLAGNLKPSFLVIQDTVSIDTLMMPVSEKLTDKEKIIRVCAAMYHIAQLVSSNHSQQLLKILKSKEDGDKKSVDEKSKPVEEEKNEEGKVKKGNKIPLVNGSTEIDDSDIFFEDFGKGLNTTEALELECKHLRREIENLNQKLSAQFKFYTGMRNFEVFNNLLGFLQSHISHISTEKLTHFQQLHLILIRFKLNLEVQDLAYMFNVDMDHIVHLTRGWMDIMAQKLSRYIDWPGGVEDPESEKRLLGSVKLKYQILWSPHQAPRNRDTGRDREKLDYRKLLRVCAGVYNIDDIEVFKDGKRELKMALIEDKNEKTNEQLEKECMKLRSEMYDLKKHIISNIVTCFTEESFKKNDQMVKYYTGFPSFTMLKSIFSFIIPENKTESRKALSPFLQFMSLLIRLKLNISSNDLAFRFGMSNSNIYKLTQDWLLLLHSKLAPHITWPDDDEDVEVFTDMLRETYLYLKNNITPRRNEGKSDSGFFDIATLVCAGLYNVGEVSFNTHSDSEFESFDDW